MEITKKFNLPKDFAKRWVTALRSGKYEQSNDNGCLHFRNRYCCLGVGGAVCGMSVDVMGNNSVLPKIDIIPTEIQDYEKLAYILMCLNDGLSLEKYEEFKEQVGVTFRKFLLEDVETTSLTFSEIADFIEDNCNFI